MHHARRTLIATLLVAAFAATGCRDQEVDPPVEDEFTIPLGAF